MTTATNTTTAPQNNISEVRKMLLDQMAALRSASNPELLRQEIERGQALGQIAQVITNTAKVEVDYIKATGQDRNAFLDAPADGRLTAITTSAPAGPANGITSITRHTLQG